MRSKVFAAIAIALLLSTVCLTAAPLQQNRTQQPPAAAQDKTASGQLSKVDTTEREITIKGSDNKEMVFNYNEGTKISGVNGPQGLMGKTGSTLKVTYREIAGKNIASQIEVESAQR